MSTLNTHTDQSAVLAKHSPQQLIQEAARICEELISLLEEENACLEKKEMARIEDIGREKASLSNKLEGLLSTIKTWSSTASDDDKTTAKTLAEALKGRLAAMNKLAERNFVLLESKYVATTNFLDIVRKSISKPKAATYGSTGKTTEDENVSLVTKSV